MRILHPSTRNKPNRVANTGWLPLSIATCETPRTARTPSHRHREASRNPVQSVPLTRFLAARGLASRRRAADLVRAGRVRVGGAVVTEPGRRVAPEADDVQLDGRPLPARPPPPRTLALYKPRGYVCSTRGQSARTVYALLPEGDARLVPAGRLDKDSEGLLILSGDGELVNRLTHPRYGHAKTYRVTVSGAVDDRALAALRAPLTIDGYRTRPAEAVVRGAGDKPGRTVLEFVLREGRNQQVRRLCRRAGLTVHRLVRTAVGNYTLKGLKPGQWREVTGRR
ncbi:MAG: rRNA pseudouridine synthase [Lentisphaerae bacterium]|nr:rRNA pseudouridine synthase [Lentisphaerota bacterium]